MKKQYSKPEIKKVRLVMDEAVLTGCKRARESTAIRGGRTCASNGCRFANVAS